MHHVPLAFQCIYECSDERGENRDEEMGGEWRLLGLLYEDDLVLCGESKEDLRTMVGQFVKVCRRRGLKFNARKSKVIVMNGEEVHVDGVRLEHISEFKYLECVLVEEGTDRTECSKKVGSGRRVAGTIRSLVNATDLQIKCASLA